MGTFSFIAVVNLVIDPVYSLEATTHRHGAGPEAQLIRAVSGGGV